MASDDDDDPGTLRGSQINKELDRLGKRGSKNTDAMIKAGRGYEKPTETRAKDDPLSQEYKSVSDRTYALREEIKARAGTDYDRLPYGVGRSPRYAKDNHAEGTSKAEGHIMRDEHPGDGDDREDD